MSSGELPIESILRGSADEALARAVDQLYCRLDDRIASYGARCWNRGWCCQFGRYGHYLFATTVELAYFVRFEGLRLRRPSGRWCPYHEGGLCAARPHRPVGCRIFFCDPAGRWWQGREYEAVQRELVALHLQTGLSYCYTEWNVALTSLAEVLSGGRSQMSGPVRPERGVADVAQQLSRAGWGLGRSVGGGR
ncbi:MAG: hypothetical protein ACE5K7_03735 [Phycisphaerae bacterium]